MGVLGSRDGTVVVLERLDVDGVGGTRLESIAAKAAEWRDSILATIVAENANVKVTSVEKTIPDCFSRSTVVSILCRKRLYAWF